MTTTMTNPNGRTRKSLAEQIDRLDAILDGLSEALQGAVAAAVQEAAGRAVQEAVQAVLAEALTNPALRERALPVDSQPAPQAVCPPIPRPMARLAAWLGARVGGWVRACVAGLCWARDTAVRVSLWTRSRLQRPADGQRRGGGRCQVHPCAAGRRSWPAASLGRRAGGDGRPGRASAGAGCGVVRVTGPPSGDSPVSRPAWPVNLPGTVPAGAGTGERQPAQGDPAVTRARRPVAVAGRMPKETATPVSWTVERRPPSGTRFGSAKANFSSRIRQLPLCAASGVAPLQVE
jgi:hypothetical protein